MPTVQTSYGRPGPSPTRWLQLTIDVRGIAADVVNELERKLKEFKKQLETETAGTGELKVNVKRF